MDMAFIILSWLLGGFAVAYGVLLWRERGEKSCRWRWQALILGLPSLVWCGHHGCLMLEGPLASLHPVVWLMVPVLAILSWFLIDYLFARSAGGFFVLAANELLHRGFADGVVLRPLYSVVCLLMGIAGLYMIGIPWRLRQLLSGHWGRRVSRIAAIVLFFCSLILFILPFFCRYSR